MYHPVLFQFVTDVLDERYDSVDSSSEVVRELNFTVSLLFLLLVSGQLPTVQTCMSPDEWCYWFGSGPGWGVVLGTVVLVGNSLALFLSSGELFPVGSCPRNPFAIQ